MKKDEFKLSKEFSQFMENESFRDSLELYELKTLEKYNFTIGLLEHYEQDTIEFVREQKKAPYSLTKGEREELVYSQEMIKHFKMVKEYTIERRKFFMEIFFKEDQ